jgi:hypothetical protein
VSFGRATPEFDNAALVRLSIKPIGSETTGKECSWHGSSGMGNDRNPLCLIMVKNETDGFFDLLARCCRPAEYGATFRRFGHRCVSVRSTVTEETQTPESAGELVRLPESPN